MKGYSFSITGDLAAARDIVYGVIKDQEFTLKQTDEWSADAERGSSGKSALLGAFAGKKGRHVKLQIKCQSGSEASTITLLQGTSGWSGGLIGKGQAETIYTGIYDAITAAFQNAGITASGSLIDK